MHLSLLFVCIFILDPRSDPSGKRPKGNRFIKIGISIGIIVGILLLLGLTVVLFVVIRSRLREKRNASQTTRPIPPVRRSRSNEQ